MKLLHLSFKNITSFKGIHEIDFRKFNNEELFAITGNTGSGKSSILTAISLALYGKNYKKSLISNDFIGSYQDDAFSKLTFKHNNEEYVAYWEIKLKKKDKTPIKNVIPKRVLFKNQILQEITAEELINLSFEQFTKTVILNQGEFSRFLMSSFSERRTILEKLYQHDHVPFLGKTLAWNIKHLDERLNQLKMLMDNTHMDSKDEIIQMDSRLDIASETKHVVDQLVDQLNNETTYYQDLIKLLAKENELITLLHHKESEHALTWDLCQKKLVELNQQEKWLEQYRTSYQQKLPRLQNAISLKHELDRHRGELVLIKDQQRNLEKNLATKNNRIETLEQNLKEIDTDFLKYQELCESLPDKSNLDNVRNLLHSLNHQGHELAMQQQHLDLKRAQIQKGEEKIQNTLETIRINRLRLTELITQIKSFDQTCLEQRILNQLKDVQDAQKAKQQHTLQQPIILDLQKQINQTEHDLLNLKQEKTLLERDFHQIMEQTENSLLEESIVRCQEKSNQLHKCVVCQTHLPTMLSIKSLDQNNLQGNKQDLKVQLDDIQMTLFKKEQILLQLKETLSLKQSESTKWEEMIYSLDRFEGEFLLSKEQLNQLNELNHQMIQIQSLIDSLNSYLDKEQIELEQLRNTYHDFSSSIRVKQNDLTLIKEKIKHSYNRYDLALTQAQALLEVDQKNLEKLHLINNKRLLLSEELRIQQLEKDQLFDELTELKKRVHSLEQIIRDTEVKFIEELGSEVSTVDPDMLMISLQNELAKLEKETHILSKETREQEYQKDLLLEKINSIKHDLKTHHVLRINLTNDILRLKSLTHPLLNRLMELDKDWDNSLLKGHLQSQFKLQALTLEQTAPEIHLMLEHFNHQLLSPLYLKIKEQQKTLNEEIIHIQYRIKSYKQQEQLMLLYQKEHTELLKKQQINHELMTVIGVSEFRNFISSFMEDRLLVYTNHELKNLYDGRFKIIKKTNPTGGNDFFVQDNYSADAQRKIQTLSGGEIFLVSLSMALALSEISKGQSKIESFFIDEGFGNLDQESMEDALKILQRIKLRGKQVGIISHIQELTGRIPINISLHKSLSEGSRISIIYN